MGVLQRYSGLPFTQGVKYSLYWLCLKRLIVKVLYVISQSSYDIINTPTPLKNSGVLTLI